MEIRAEFLWILLGTSLVTLIPRVLPLVVLSRMQLPHWALRYLSHIPVAVMAALLAQDLFTANGEPVPILSNLKLLALVPTLLVAVKTRSLLGTVIAGILSMMAIQLFL